MVSSKPVCVLSYGQGHYYQQHKHIFDFWLTSSLYKALLCSRYLHQGDYVVTPV